MSRVVQYRADCENCPAPLGVHYGRWSHHWLYVGACKDPKPINARMDGVPIDPDTKRPLSVPKQDREETTK